MRNIRIVQTLKEKKLSKQTIKTKACSQDGWGRLQEPRISLVWSSTKIHFPHLLQSSATCASKPIFFKSLLTPSIQVIFRLSRLLLISHSPNPPPSLPVHPLVGILPVKNNVADFASSYPLCNSKLLPNIYITNVSLNVFQHIHYNIASLLQPSF